MNVVLYCIIVTHLYNGIKRRYIITRTLVVHIVP